MRKQLQPIRLQRETLRQLATPNLDKARGAWIENTNYISCPHPQTCICTR